MTEMTYKEFLQNSKIIKNKVSKKSIFDNEIVVGVLILCISVLFFMLFKEFLENYGDKMETKNRQIKEEIIRKQIERKKRNMDSFKDSDSEGIFLSKNQIPEPIPVMEKELNEMTGIENIGIIRDVKPNKNMVFSKQLALDDEQMTTLIKETREYITNNPIDLDFKNYPTLIKQDKIRTIHTLTTRIVNSFLKIFNTKMKELEMYNPNHLIEDFILINYRIVNRLDADYAYYNKVWVEEGETKTLLPRNQVVIQEEDKNGTMIYKAFRKNNISGTSRIKLSDLTENDRILVKKHKKNNLLDYLESGNKFHIRFGRDNKFQFFTLYLETNMSYSSETSSFKITIKDLVLIDTTNNYSLMVNDNAELGYKNPLNLDSNKHTNIASSAKPYDIFNENDIPKNYFDDEFKIKVIDGKNYERAVSDRQDKHKCFAVVGGRSREIPFNNKMYCESYHTNLGQIGIWDGPCQINEECPFYKGNKNYENELGGCNNGYCEMPLGVTRIGYKKYTDEPFCYNCPTGTDSICCQQQHLDSKKDESRILSPDFVFIGDCETDNLMRKNSTNIEALNEKGLENCPSI